MSSFSIDMSDPKEAWDALFREIDATAEPECGEAPVGFVSISSQPGASAEDLVGWLWLMHACWADDAS